MVRKEAIDRVFMSACDVDAIASIHSFTGGYYTIEQRKSRLRIIILNTNFMRHSGHYAPGQSAAVRSRGSHGGNSAEVGGSSNYYHHHGNYYHNSNNNNNNGYHASVNGMDRNGGGHVSALSGADSHESQRQWIWLEEVLAKSSLNKETVCK